MRKLFSKISMIPYDSNIHKTFKHRLKKAGGQTGNVRISLIWYDRNDLDLHVIAPCGDRIWFQNKHSKCGGMLDVDMNVNGETTEPVENVFWPIGKAPLGRYQVFVQNFRYHTIVKREISYIVEVSINNKSKFFKGAVLGVGLSSEQVVCRFNFRSSSSERSKKFL